MKNPNHKKGKDKPTHKKKGESDREVRVEKTKMGPRRVGQRNGHQRQREGIKHPS